MQITCNVQFSNCFVIVQVNCLVLLSPQVKFQLQAFTSLSLTVLLQPQCDRMHALMIKLIMGSNANYL